MNPAKIVVHKIQCYVVFQIFQFLTAKTYTDAMSLPLFATLQTLEAPSSMDSSVLHVLFPRLNDACFKFHQPAGEHILREAIANRIRIAANAAKVPLNS